MLPPLRRTWPIALGVVLLLVALPMCVFSIDLRWDAPAPAGLDTHRLALEHGRLVMENDTVNTPSPTAAMRFDTRFDPGLSIEYAETFVAPSARTKRVPIAIFLIAGAIASILFAFYHKKHPIGHCTECGYDLKDSGMACPECGHAAGSSTVSR